LYNILTIDLEEWFHTNGLDIPVAEWGGYKSRISASTYKLLDLLEEYSVKATFFVVGCIAAEHAGLIREISRRGHEIGSHGYWHRMVSRMSLADFRKDLRESKAVLEDATGLAVSYYRAPSWSISADRYEALGILEDEGFLCDSSLQPFRTPLSGATNLPVYPFRPIVDGRKLNLVEIPPSVLQVGPIRIPFAGGFYLRFWPGWLVKRALKLVNRQRAGMVYAHPWELDPDIPRVETSMLIKAAQYYRLPAMEQNLRGLLSGFTFVSLGEYLCDAAFPFHHLSSVPPRGDAAR